MNQSIYLMISVPYLALAVFGFLIYRGCKQNAAYRQTLAQAALGQANASTSPAVIQSGAGAT